MINSLFYTLVSLLMFLFPVYALIMCPNIIGVALSLLSVMDGLWVLWWYRRFGLH